MPELVALASTPIAVKATGAPGYSSGRIRSPACTRTCAHLRCLRAAAHVLGYRHHEDAVYLAAVRDDVHRGAAVAASRKGAHHGPGGLRLVGLELTRTEAAVGKELANDDRIRSVPAARRHRDPHAQPAREPQRHERGDDGRARAHPHRARGRHRGASGGPHRRRAGVLVRRRSEARRRRSPAVVLRGRSRGARSSSA